MKKKIFMIGLAGIAMILTGCNSTSSIGNLSDSTPTSSSTPTSETSLEETSIEENKEIIVNAESDKAIEQTVSELIAKGKITDTTNLYRTTGKVMSIDNYDYGDIYLSDGQNTIQVYGLCKSPSCITESDGLTFSNSKDFSSLDISVGDTITMECIYQYYIGYSSDEGKPELLGYITSYISSSDNNNNNDGSDYTGDEVYEGNYYNSVDQLTGRELENGLHDLEIATQKTWVDYSSGLASHLPKSDKGTNGKIELFYNGESGSWNREHVWPQSLTNKTFGTTGAGCDIQHIRPTNSKNNSSRGNKTYGEVSYSTGTITRRDGGTNKYNGSSFEPADSIKGDVARIIMYVYVHYSNALGSNPGNEKYTGDLQITKVIAANGEQNAWNLLRKWSASDPVSSIERQRNNYAYNVQGNRNPFIDHPSYADSIWG